MLTLLSNSTAQDTAQTAQALYGCGTASVMPPDYQPEHACLIAGHTPDVE